MAKSTSTMRGTAKAPKDRLIRLAGELETDYKSSYYEKSYDFPYNPDSLVSANNYSIYDEMRDDSQVKATLAIKKNMIIGNGWRIACGEEVEEGMAEKITKQITDTLEHIAITETSSSTFESLLIEILSAYDYGFSLSEVIYKYEDGMYKINKFVTRPPHTFEFDIDDKGNITSVVQNSNYGKVKFNPDIFFHFIYQPEFGNPYGKSDLKSAHEAWKAKKWISRFMNMYLEKYASPFAVLRYPSTLHPDEINRLETISKKIRTSHAVVIPDVVTLTLEQAASGTTDGYIRALEYYNLQIARSLLVPDLMGFGGGETEGGSYALGKEQFNLFMGSIFSDKQNLSRKLTTRVVMPLVRANFGDYPTWFEFVPPSDENIIEYAKTWATAVGAKLWKPNEEEVNHFRVSLGFPEGEIEEVENPLEDAKTEALKKGMNQKPVNKNKQDDKEKKEFKMRRPPNRYEKKMDFAEIESTLNSFDAKISRAVKGAGKDVIDSILDQIKLNPKAINKLEPKYMKQMNRVVKENFIEVVKKSRLIAKNEILSKNFAEEDDELRFYENIVEQESFKTVGDYSARMSTRASNMLAKGLKNNLAYSEIVKIIRDDLYGESEKWINTVVRTKTNEIFNETRKRFFETNEVAKEIVVAYQWSSIIDTRTSAICGELDGKIFTVSEYTNIVKPPAHFNCRSQLVPITKFEDYQDDPNFLQGDDLYDISEIHDMGGNLIQGRV